MTDRKMLELAAKAYWGDEIDDVCSIEWDEDDQAIAYTHADNQDHNGNDQTFLWNPLTDDGDALRLSVRLRMDVQHFEGLEMCEAWKHPYQACGEDYGCDPYAATRRAITRAAAEIGKSMEGKA